MLYRDHIYVAPPYRDLLHACGLASVAAVLDRVDGQVAAWSRTTDTLRVACPAGGPGLFLKRYRYPTWRHRFRGTFRGTFFRHHRGRDEFRLLDVMRGLGIPAVRPIAYGSRRLGHFVTACFLITEEAPQSMNLTTLAAEVDAGRRTLSSARRRAMSVELAAQVAHMHNVGFSHGQLFWRNILFRLSDAGDPEFFFLDTRPGRGRRWFGRRGDRYLNELAHAAASALPFTTRTDRLRFLRTYFRERHLRADFRAVDAFLAGLARRWRSHEQQRIRMSRRFEDWGRQLETEQPAAAAVSAGS
jgi:hypothetical protein